MVINDPSNQNALQLQALKLAKCNVNGVMAGLNSDEAGFLNQHFGTIAALTNVMDKSLGIISDAGERYFTEIERKLKEIERKLKEIELAYQRQYRTQGVLIGQQFFIERHRLFSELNVLLNKLSRLTLKIKPYNNLRHALGLSSKAIVHEWSTVGVGSIRGYSTYVNNAAKAALK